MVANAIIDKDFLIKGFVKNFVQKDRAERTYLELSNPKKRNKFSDRLNHTWDSVLDMRRLARIEKTLDNSADIQKLLQIKNEEICYLISNYSEYDDRFLRFDEVFEEIYSRGFATIFLNASATTLFLDTEQVQGPSPRFIGKV